mgnify:CR=1 FL=1
MGARGRLQADERVDEGRFVGIAGDGDHAGMRYHGCELSFFDACLWSLEKRADGALQGIAAAILSQPADTLLSKVRCRWSPLRRSLIPPPPRLIRAKAKVVMVAFLHVSEGSQRKLGRKDSSQDWVRGWSVFRGVARRTVLMGRCAADHDRWVSFPLYILKVTLTFIQTGLGPIPAVRCDQNLARSGGRRRDSQGLE